MSGRLSNLRTRLVKLERRLGDVARREQLAKCNCNFKGVYSFRKPEEFEAEMNLLCPAHGFRDLGQFVVFKVHDEHGASADSVGDTRRAQPVATYKARRARHQDDLELKENDFEEF